MKRHKWMIVLFTLCMSACITIEANAQLLCKGSGWPCKGDCYRAEFIKFDADCTNLNDGSCCIYLYAFYRCRTKPDCGGNECGNTKELVLLD